MQQQLQDDHLFQVKNEERAAMEFQVLEEMKKMALFSETHSRIEELETECRNSKESEEKTKDLLATHMKTLEESKLEIKTLREKIVKLEKSSDNSHDHQKHEAAMKEELSSLKSELESTKQKVGMLKNELKLATEAEENEKKAMDDLALALKEVATEANQMKEKYCTCEDELMQAKEELENSKNNEEKYKSLLNEARREADIFKSTVERLRLEAEESILAWNGRETSLVDCIRRAEEDRFNAQQENRRLMDSLRLAELKNMTSKEEIKKLRDILKQALNEANVAKEAAEIAKEENSQLKDCLAEKENALDFLGIENEDLKVNHAAALEKITELMHLLDEATNKGDQNRDEEEKVMKNNIQNSGEKEHQESIVRRFGKAFSFSFMEVRVNAEKKKEVEKEAEMEETLKGSIFDEMVDSPGSLTDYHQKQSNSHHESVEDRETVNEDDFDEMLEENHFDDLENERNSRKKKALIRRFGDLLMRRRSFHKKEPSLE